MFRIIFLDINCIWLVHDGSKFFAIFYHDHLFICSSCFNNLRGAFSKLLDEMNGVQ